MLIWKNTSILDGFDKGLIFTHLKEEAEIALVGSKSIDIGEYPNLKGIFRAGVGKDNIPIDEAEKLGVLVRFPSQQTIKIIYEETANFTCGLILRMLYNEVGSLDPWLRYDRVKLSDKVLLVVGKGNIGGRVAAKMRNFMNVITYDVLYDSPSELKNMISVADCITLHIPKSKENESFINAEKLSWMKNASILINTSRAAVVDEDDFYNEIKQGRIFSAFDVFWKEPYDGKLKVFHPKNFYMTPHVSSNCDAFARGCRMDLDNYIVEAFI